MTRFVLVFAVTLTLAACTPAGGQGDLLGAPMVTPDGGVSLAEAGAVIGVRQTATAQAYQAQAAAAEATRQAQMAGTEQARADARATQQAERDQADARETRQAAEWQTQQAAWATQTVLSITLDANALALRSTVAAVRATETAVVLAPAQTAVAATATTIAVMDAQTATPYARQQQAQADRDARERGAWWFWLSVIGVGVLLVSISAGVSRWFNSRAVEAEARADEIRARADRDATIVQHYNNMIVVIGPLAGPNGYRQIRTAMEQMAAPTRVDTSVPALPSIPVFTPTGVSELARLSPEAREMAEFVQAARAKVGDEAAWLPTAPDMGVGGDEWWKKVKALVAAGAVDVRRGRPRLGEHNTILVGQWRTLADLQAAIERGSLEIALLPHSEAVK